MEGPAARTRGGGAAQADIADYPNWYNALQPNLCLVRFTPDEACFGDLPKLKLAAQDQMRGARRIAHRVGRLVASDYRRPGQLCTVGNPPAVH